MANSLELVDGDQQHFKNKKIHLLVIVMEPIA
jgi:hypothetical protein